MVEIHDASDHFRSTQSGEFGLTMRVHVTVVSGAVLISRPHLSRSSPHVQPIGTSHLAEFGRTRLGYGTTGMFLYPHYGGRAGGCGRWLTLRGEWRIDRSLSRCKLLAVESVKPKCSCTGKSMGIWRIVPRLPGWLRANRGPMVRKRSDSAGASVID